MGATPNSDPATALDKLFELALKLTDLMQRGLGERGLTASRAEVLLLLDKDGAMVQRQLSESLRCTPRYVTSLVDALEADGLAKRSPHPSDRRATLVSLTKRGAAAAARLAAERDQAARWLLGDVPRAELGVFVDVANQVLQRIGTALPDATPSSRERPDPRLGAPRSQPRGRARRRQSSGPSSPTAEEEES